MFAVSSRCKNDSQFTLFGHTQCYLPSDSGDFPTFTSAEAGTRFSDPEGCKAELT